MTHKADLTTNITCETPIDTGFELSNKTDNKRAREESTKNRIETDGET